MFEKVVNINKIRWVIEVAYSGGSLTRTIICYVKDSGGQLAAVTTLKKLIDLPYSNFISLVAEAGANIRTPFGIVKRFAGNGKRYV